MAGSVSHTHSAAAPATAERDRPRRPVRVPDDQGERRPDRDPAVRDVPLERLPALQRVGRRGHSHRNVRAASTPATTAHPTIVTRWTGRGTSPCQPARIASIAAPSGVTSDTACRPPGNATRGM